MPSESLRLHPLSVLVGVPLAQIGRLVVLPLAAALFGGGSDRGRLVVSSAVAILLLGALVLRVLAWRRFTWSFDGEAVRVEQGVLSRSRRVVSVDRIQQVELDRPFVQRLLGVATLRIETAGSDAGPEVELRVLSLEDALALRASLQPHREPHRDAGHGDVAVVAGAAADPAVPPPDTEPDVIVRLTLGEVALSSVTGAQLLLAPALLAGALQVVGDRTTELVEAAATWLLDAVAAGAAPSASVWAAGALLVAVTAVVTTLVVSVVRDGGFVVLRQGDDLVVRRGLLGTRESTVPLLRVQVVRVVANPLRRALGVAMLRIHSAGGSASDSGRRVVVPLVRADRVDALLTALLPDVDVVPVLRPHPPAALRRAVVRRLLAVTELLTIVTVGWVLLLTAEEGRWRAELPLPGPVATLAGLDGAVWAVPLALILGLGATQVGLAVLEHRALGHGVDRGVLAARSGAVARTLSVAPIARLQGVTHRTSWFQRRRGLATVRAHVAGPGGDVTVLDAGEDDASRLRGLLAEAAAGGVRPPARPPGGP